VIDLHRQRLRAGPRKRIGRRHERDRVFVAGVREDYSFR
jgi:hypothetical protein